MALAVALVAVVLLLWPADPPETRTDPRAAARVQAKVEQAAQTAVEGHAPVLQMDEAELNAWIQSNLALPSSPTPDAPRTSGPTGEPTLQQVQSSLRDVKISLVGDGLRAYVLFTLYGKGFTLQLEGRLVVTDRRLRLRHARDARLAPNSSGDTRARGEPLFDSPENRDSFQLPPEIKDIRVANGELIVSYR